MRIKKTMSDKAIAANRRNAQHSLGPRRVATVKYNAVTHGILVKGIAFHTDQEESEFNELLSRLKLELAPADTLEQLLIEEIALCFWKLKIALRLELEDIRVRQKGSDELLYRLISNCDDETLSALADARNARDSGGAGNPGWDCSEVVVTAGPQKPDALGKELGDMAATVNVELRLTSVLSTIMRYEGTLKRDLFRAIAMLQNLQKREKRVGTKSANQPEETHRNPPGYGAI